MTSPKRAESMILSGGRVQKAQGFMDGSLSPVIETKTDCQDQLVVPAQANQLQSMRPQEVKALMFHIVWFYRRVWSLRFWYVCQGCLDLWVATKDQGDTLGLSLLQNQKRLLQIQVSKVSVA
jgi:hypothetical protein